jgi:hypothetical protein
MTTFDLFRYKTFLSAWRWRSLYRRHPERDETGDLDQQFSLALVDALLIAAHYV